VEHDAETADAIARLAKIRQLCDELDRAIKDSAKQRALIVRTESDADAAYLALSKKV
jgi:hypothetical protein